MNNQPLCHKCGSTYGTNIECPYCGAHNDVDLYIDSIVVNRSVEETLCPDCRVPLEHVSMGNLSFLRCPCCFLKLTTRGFVEELSRQKVAEVFSYDRKRLTILLNANYQATKSHLKECPTCRELMHRVPLVKGSNIGIDECYQCRHIILDNGQLLQLLEWKHAGGEKYTPSVVRAENVEIRGETLASVRAARFETKFVKAVLVLVVVGFAFNWLNKQKQKKIVSEVISLYDSNQKPSYSFDIKRRKEYRYSRNATGSPEEIKAYYDDYFANNTYWDSIFRKENYYILSTESTAIAVVFPDHYYDKLTYIFQYRSFMNLPSRKFITPVDIDVQVSH